MLTITAINVIDNEGLIMNFYAECYNAECRIFLIMLSVTSFHVMLILLDIFHFYAECRNAECRYTECHYAECRGTPLFDSTKVLLSS